MVMMAIPELALKVGLVKAQKGSLEVLAPSREGSQGGDLDHCWLASLVGGGFGGGCVSGRGVFSDVDRMGRGVCGRDMGKEESGWLQRWSPPAEDGWWFGASDGISGRRLGLSMRLPDSTDEEE